MTEASITSDLVDYLKWNCPGKHYKIHDEVTIGVPDLALTAKGRTTWVEVKLIKLQSKTLEVIDAADIVLRSKNGRLQLETMRQYQTHGLAWYLVFVVKDAKWWTLILKPSTLHNMVPGPRGQPLILSKIVLTSQHEGKKFKMVAEYLNKEREGL